MAETGDEVHFLFRDVNLSPVREILDRLFNNVFGSLQRVFFRKFKMFGSFDLRLGRGCDELSVKAPGNFSQ